MYYVNREQIERRLHVLPDIASVLQQTLQVSKENLIGCFARERALHLAIEVVTDVGSYLIDGFIMRDASSYEDIIEVIHGEGVISQELYAALSKLVRLRKPLVQEYYDVTDEIRLNGQDDIQEVLNSFATQVHEYLSHN